MCEMCVEYTFGSGSANDSFEHCLLVGKKGKTNLFNDMDHQIKGKDVMNI